MKSILPHTIKQNANDQLLTRLLTNARLLIAGTPQKPSAPRGVRFSQKTDTSGLLFWEPPAVPSQVTGYRVYRDIETTLAIEIGDPKTLQAQVDMPTSRSVNFFVSAVNGQAESAKIQVQGKLT